MSFTTNLILIAAGLIVVVAGYIIFSKRKKRSGELSSANFQSLNIGSSQRTAVKTRQQQATIQATPNQRPSTASSPGTSRVSSTPPVLEQQPPPVVNQEGQAMYELTKLANYNGALAQRLVEQVQSKHPQRPKLWCIEKAIEDLLRDRR